MSDGFGPSWVEDDWASHGEQVARCKQAGCNSPLYMLVCPWVIVFRCTQGHVAELHCLYDGVTP